MNKLNFLIRKLCPNGVRYLFLKDCVEYSRGKGLTKESVCNGNIPIILYGELYTTYGNYIDSIKSYSSDESISASRLVKKNSLLCPISSTTKEAQIGKASLLRCCDIYLGGDAISLFPIEKVNSAFLMFYINSTMFEKNKMKHVKGTTIRHLDPFGMLDIKVPVPPMEVQLEIVHILDKFTELTARKKQYEYYKSLVFYSRNIEKFKISDVLNIKTGKGVTKKDSNDNGTYPIISGGTSPMGYIDIFNRDENTVTISRVGANAGHVMFQSTKYYLNDKCFSATPKDVYKDKVNTRFLFHYLKSIETEIMHLQSEGGVPTINISKLGQLKLFIPALTEQQQIVDILDRFDAYCNDIIQGLPAEIKARQQQYEYYRDKLLSFKELDDARN